MGLMGLAQLSARADTHVPLSKFPGDRMLEDVHMIQFLCLDSQPDV